LGVDPALQKALDFAGDDAFRLGQSDIDPENLVFGLLRSGGLALMFITKVSGVDLDRFRAHVWDRVSINDNVVDRPKLPLNAASQAIIQAAIAIATEKRRETLQGLHLLYALTQDERGPLAELLARYGSSAATLKGKMESSL
jgi:ATP-dependent Clp protease ATP-binding subunit ClpA